MIKYSVGHTSRSRDTPSLNQVAYSSMTVLVQCHPESLEPTAMCFLKGGVSTCPRLPTGVLGMRHLFYMFVVILGLQTPWGNMYLSIHQDLIYIVGLLEAFLVSYEMSLFQMSWLSVWKVAWHWEINILIGNKGMLLLIAWEIIMCLLIPLGKWRKT